MIAIGIDPGKTGCLWAVNGRTRHTHSFYDIERIGNNIDIVGIANYLKQFNPATAFVIAEDPHPHGQEGEVKTVYAGFEYGKSVGIIYGTVIALGFNFIRVAPATWKGHFAITSGKSTYKEKKNNVRRKSLLSVPTEYIQLY